MKTIKERIQENDTSLTFEEIINDTLEYYSKDPDSRRCKSDEHSFYSPINADKPNSEGCAVGRYLTESQQNECDLKPDTAINSIHYQHLPEFINNNIEFFSRLQSFHDDDRCFKNNKVTEFGLFTIDKLKKVDWATN